MANSCFDNTVNNIAQVIAMEDLSCFKLSQERKKQMQATLELARQREEEYFTSGVIQLPLWREDRRGAPNSFLRSALFAAIQSKDRSELKKAQLFSQQGITITRLINSIFPFRCKIYLWKISFGETYDET